MSFSHPIFLDVNFFKYFSVPFSTARIVLSENTARDNDIESHFSFQPIRIQELSTKKKCL
jgi:hypothetical protein